MDHTKIVPADLDSPRRELSVRGLKELRDGITAISSGDICPNHVQRNYICKWWHGLRRLFVFGVVIIRTNILQLLTLKNRLNQIFSYSKLRQS